MSNQPTTETLPPMTPVEYRALIRDFFRDHDDTLWRIDTDSWMAIADGFSHQCVIYYRGLRMVEVVGDMLPSDTLAEQDAVRRALALLQEGDK